MEQACPTCGSKFKIETQTKTVLNCPTCRGTLALRRSGSGPIQPGVTPAELIRVIPVEISETFQRRYELCEMLGCGAMGMVFLANDRLLHRCVAIKFLNLKTDPELGARFLREARLMAALNHPYVVQILDMGEDHGRPYLVSEFMEGGTLRALLKVEKRLPHARVGQIAIDCLSGLAACHDAGIVHRDVKPENILFTKGGIAKVADLGIARAEATDTYLTHTGALIGTPLYMAPEQVKAGKVGPEADLYSLAVVVYEMLAGGPPFQASTAFELLRKHVDDPPPPLEGLVNDVPEPFTRLVIQALSKDPAQRPPSAVEFAHAVRACLPDDSGAVREALRHSGEFRRSRLGVVASPSPRGRAILAAVLVAGCGVAATAAWHLHRPRVPTEPPATMTPTPPPSPGLAKPVPTVRPGSSHVSVQPAVRASAPSSRRTPLVTAGTDEEEYHSRVAVEADPTNVSALTSLGLLLVRKERLAEAQECFRKALAVEPGSIKALTCLAALLEKKNDLPGAEALCKRLCETSPDDFMAHVNYGTVLYKRGRTSAAEEQFKTAVRLKPTSATAHTKLGVAFGRRGALVRAEQHHRMALDLDPGNSLAHGNLASVLAAKRNVESTERRLRLALLKDSKSAGLHCKLGVVLAAKGDFAQAQAEIREAMTLAPTNPQFKGVLYQIVGDSTWNVTVTSMGEDVLGR
ncbi:MAG: protein kinase [Candidatus Riflebacteria bacterium]|nr:protein kinase [Candidatus Riflebacteria bacterium]